LLDLLPPLHIIDAILDYYFEFCNWVYRHVNPPAFQNAWRRFKNGNYPDRIVLGTVAVLVALSIRYLPPGHELLSGLPGDENYCTELSTQYYDVMKKALRRYQDETKVYTIELIELLLVRCHYLSFIKTDPEEIWAVRGECITIGTAMGLHRDPGENRFSRDVAERRRWAWWYVVLHERSVLLR
jgi:Fungal specific transcription factor domain